MDILLTVFQPTARLFVRWLHCCLLSIGLAACGGGNDTPGPTVPSITTQPAGVTVTAGAVASFSVTAAGSDPLAYQWQMNGTPIAGATSANYTTPATAATDNGALFTVVVSNTEGSVTSNAATLTMGVPVAPSIVTPPAAQSVVEPAAATFSVVANGTAPLSYQWTRNGTAIDGATAASYTTPATTVVDSGALLAVTVTNVAGTAPSDNATLTVTAAPIPPTITTQPANQTVNTGQTASFSVEADGTAPLAYQWSRNGAAIVGATTAKYTTPVTLDADTGATFRVLVTNGGGNATSAEATLTVTTLTIIPAITARPASVSVMVGQAASFSVVATGSAPLNYQWQRGGSMIAGATSATYTIANAAVTDNGARFTVVVSNSAGSVATNAATLTVNASLGRASIGTGDVISMAVKSNDTALFWGLSDTTGTPFSYIPKVLDGMTGIVQAAGSFNEGPSQHFLLRIDGTVVGWGHDDGGELGNGVRLPDSVVFPSTAAVVGLADATQISCGNKYTLALRADGTVVAWGTNTFGTLGNDLTTYPYSSVPLPVPGVANAKQVAAGGYHALALLGDGTVLEWGVLTGGTLPNAAVRTVEGLENIVSIAAGYDFVMALRSDGIVFLWGSFAQQAGNGPGNSAPTLVTGLQGVVTIAAGRDHALALKSDGTVMAWGENVDGEVGNGTPTILIPLPVVVTGLTNVVQVAAGRGFSLALLSNGSVAAWGANGYGQLGNGTNIESRVPVVVPGLNLLAP